MTEEERQMMVTIHLYGMIFSLGDNAKEALMDCMETVLERKGESPSPLGT